MRNEARIDEILGLISNIWHAYPDLRFGQLVENFAIKDKYSMFYQEDDTTKALLEHYAEKYGK